MADTIGTPDFAPQNELEFELVRATHEPAFRNAFLRQLLHAEVFLALLPDREISLGPDGQRVLTPDTRLELGPVEHDGKPLFPFFSSTARAQALYRQDHFIASDNVRALIERHPETEFILNPGSAYSVILWRSDIDALLRGDLTTH